MKPLIQKLRQHRKRMEINQTEPEAPADTPPQEVAPITKAKPWEPLGISRAWYYRLRQQGRLEEYIKAKP